jgi:hypothetical protein
LLNDSIIRLKLSQAAEILDTMVQQAEESTSSYLPFLHHLPEEEVAAKKKRRIHTAMKTAGLPWAKTIEEYDFSFHPNLNRKEVMELFDLTFIPHHENVIFLGPPGVGNYVKHSLMNLGTLFQCCIDWDCSSPEIVPADAIRPGSLPTLWTARLTAERSTFSRRATSLPEIDNS